MPAANERNDNVTRPGGVTVIRKIKPKYYIRKSWHYRDNCWMICQSHNNVVIAEGNNWVLGRVILEHLNSLSWRQLGGKEKVGPGIYAEIKRKAAQQGEK